MSVQVIDLNEEGKEEPPALEPIEEEEAREPEPITNTANEIIEETKDEPPTEPPKEEEKPTPKPKAKPKASDIVKCDNCDKSMTYKKLRYGHNCDPKPVKKQANPKGKAKPKPTPKPPPEVYYSDDEEEHNPLSRPVRNQVLKPQYINPQTALAQHYQLLQQQLMKQKQGKMNSLCQNMFSSKTKKR